MSRIVSHTNVFEFRYNGELFVLLNKVLQRWFRDYLVQHRRVDVMAEIITPEVTLLSSINGFYIPRSVPTFLMLSVHGPRHHYRAAPSHYRSKFTIYSLLPTDVEMESLVYGDQDLPVALKVGPSLDEISGEPGLMTNIMAMILYFLNDIISLRSCSGYFNSQRWHPWCQRQSGGLWQLSRD